MLARNSSGEYIVSNPRENIWGTIDCEVTVEETGEIIPFTANPDDPEEYGRNLYAQLNANRASVAPVDEAERYEAFSSIARSQRDNLLKQSDWTQGADIPEATKTLWQPYRQALRDVPEQEGFPYEITWPTPPA